MRVLFSSKIFEIKSKIIEINKFSIKNVKIIENSNIFEILYAEKVNIQNLEILAIKNVKNSTFFSMKNIGNLVFNNITI